MLENQLSELFNLAFFEYSLMVLIYQRFKQTNSYWLLFDWQSS